MSVIISGITPGPIAGTAARNPAPVPDAGPAPAATAPAATVEISSGARQAHAVGQGVAVGHKRDPLNIIWGDSPR